MDKREEPLQRAARDNLAEDIRKDIAAAFQNGRSMEQVIAAVLERAAKAVNAEAGTFWFYHRFEDGRIRPMAVYGGNRLDDIYLLPGEGMAGQVIDSGEALLIPDCRKDTGWSRKVDMETGFVTRTMLCVPLKTGGLVFGSIQIVNRNDEKPFEGRDLEILERLAEETALFLKEAGFLEDYVSETASEKSLAVENDARREIIRQISTYIDPVILREILRKDGKHKKSLQMEEIVVLFADIRGFTHLAEHLTPAQLISCLSDFLTITSQCIHRQDGIVDKFMGDCTMAYWRLEENASAVEAACQASIEIQKEAQSFAARILRQTGIEIGLGIGIHAGPALLCHVGDERYMAYTVIGDVVNTASRLEDNAPMGSIYISGEIVKRLGVKGVVTPLGENIYLKGKQRPFEVWVLKSLLSAED